MPHKHRRGRHSQGNNEEKKKEEEEEKKEKKNKGRSSSLLPTILSAIVAVVIAATSRTTADDQTRGPVERRENSTASATAPESFRPRCDRADESCDILSERRVRQNLDEDASAVPDECRLVLAPSALHRGGWGVFSTVPRNRGELALERGDILIHVTDPNPHQAHAMRRLVWDYLWDGTQTYGHYEGRYVLSAMPGLGMAANGVFRGASLTRPGGMDARPREDDERGVRVDNAGLERGAEPGAGAISRYHDVSWRFRRDVGAGEELFVEYGKGWFRERGFRANDDEEPAEAPRKTKPVRQLKREGYCLDNLVPGPSLLRGAGRGAFASRPIPRGQIIAPLPVIPLSSLSLEMMRIREDGSIVASSQLLKNYCFGHPDSSLLLFPYSHAVHFINHHSNAANAELRWWNGSAAYFNRTFLELQQSPSVQLMLELVATRSIEEGEEIYLDYGPQWAEAWENHVRDWHRGRGREKGEKEPHSLTSEEMNGDDAFRVIRTLEEQQTLPYPKDVFTSCYYRYDMGQTHLPNQRKHPGAKSATAWKNAQGLKSSQNLRPCLVVGREPSAAYENGNAPSAYTYTVRIMNRPGLKEAERIPQGHELIVTDVPRHALLFSDKMYSSDQHLESAFRKVSPSRVDVTSFVSTNVGSFFTAVRTIQEMSLGDLFPAQWKDRLG